MILEEPVCETDVSGTLYWRVNGLLHRPDAPAMIWADGSKFWYVHDQLHRLDGPALIYADGSKFWYIRDRHMTREINVWMEKKGITWPWSHEVQIEFELTWG